MTWTPATRVTAAFEHQEPDRVPLWGILINRHVYEHFLGPERVAEAGDVPLDEKLARHGEVYRACGIDMTRAQIWPPSRTLPEAYATVSPTHEITPDNVTGWQPTFPAVPERDREIAIRCRQILLNQPHTVFAPTIRGVFCSVFERMGLEAFSYVCADLPEQIDRLMDLQTGYAVDLATRYAARNEVTCLAIVDDMAWKSAPICAPDWMRRHWIPRLAQVVRPLKAAGKRVVFHSDGRNDMLFPDLIEIGIDGVNPLEPIAGMDLADLKRRFGKDLTLIGGVDCSQLLPFGTPQQIRDEVRRLLDIGAPGGGFIIGDSSSVAPNTPLANVMAFYETVLSYSA